MFIYAHRQSVAYDVVHAQSRLVQQCMCLRCDPTAHRGVQLCSSSEESESVFLARPQVIQFTQYAVGIVYEVIVVKLSWI